LSKLSSSLKVASSVVGLTILGFKIIADINKHAGHEAHHQLCDCLGTCYACIWVNATKKRKTTAKV
jgi:hypothetical protein